MPTNTDFASGQEPAADYPVLTQPAGQRGFGENYAFWIHDDATGIQINGHLNTNEDIGAYGLRIARLSVLFPNGRTYLLHHTGGGSDDTSVAGGSLRYRCVDPFRRWTCEFDGVMNDVTIARTFTSSAPLDCPHVHARFRIDTEMVAPAWLQGSFTEGGLGPVKGFIGGTRYEQLFRASGELRVGEEAFPIEGFGNRTHRMGVRELAGAGDGPRMLGHVWAAAAFPGGSGFALQSYPTDGGKLAWAEGHVVRNGALVPVEVVCVPWLCSYQPSGEQFRIVLRARDGEIFEVTGETLATFNGIMLPAATPAEQVPLFQSCVRYRFGGETAVNMLERSLRRGCIETGIGRPQRC